MCMQVTNTSHRCRLPSSINIFRHTAAPLCRINRVQSIGKYVLILIFISTWRDYIPSQLAEPCGVQSVGAESARSAEHTPQVGMIIHVSATTSGGGRRLGLTPAGGRGGKCQQASRRPLVAWARAAPVFLQLRELGVVSRSVAEGAGGKYPRHGRIIFVAATFSWSWVRVPYTRIADSKTRTYVRREKGESVARRR